MDNRSAVTILAIALGCCASGVAAQNPSGVTPAITLLSVCPPMINDAMRTGVVGHQFGSGRGNTVATIAGVGVGAVAGNEVEKNVKKTSYYAITVRLDSGGTRTISQSAKPGLREGDRVKIDSNNRLALLAN